MPAPPLGSRSKPRSQKLRDLVGRSLASTFTRGPQMVTACRSAREIDAEIERPGDEVPNYFSLHIAHLSGIEGQLDGRIVTLRDITAHRQHQAALETLAFFDPLTRLANRRHLDEQIEACLEQSARDETQFAILYFDLNRFKAVNDNLGHETGDELLKCVANRAQNALRAPDFAARLGGDEFVILLHSATPACASTIARRVLEDVQQPFSINGEVLLPQLSLGIAIYPRDGATLVELMRAADAEMYRAKANGGGLIETSI